MAIKKYSKSKKHNKSISRNSRRRNTKFRSLCSNTYFSRKLNFQYGGEDNDNLKISINYSGVGDIAGIANGRDLTEYKNNALKSTPVIKVPANYTGYMVMYDPDAPGPAIENNPKIFVHWIVKFNGLADMRVDLPYTGPSPPIGRHRYIFAFMPSNSELIMKPTTSTRMLDNRNIETIIGNNKPIKTYSYLVRA
jgi:hypothetical protein